MRDEPLQTPDDGESTRIDPFEAELIAYLDGELEPSAARKIEVRLAADPDARAKATALKKTFGLLDYLPKPEPSPTFASRTLERLPVPSPSSAASKSQQPNPSSPSQSANSPTVASSTAIPSSVSGSSVPLALPVGNRWGGWAAGMLIAVGLCSAVGYLVASAGYQQLISLKGTAPAPSDEISTADHALVEKLPLYAAVDDMEFINELATAEFFGDEPTVNIESAIKPPVLEQEGLSVTAFSKLATAFKALPIERQETIRDLDKQVRSLDAPTREQRFRVLETYIRWLNKLPEGDHKRVLMADTSRRRLDEIRKILNQQWIDGLPPARRAKLNGLPAAGQVELIRLWRDEETNSRDEWTFHRSHAEDILANRTPWPFDNLARQKEVIEFMRVAFRIDDEKRCRFEESERSRYTAALNLATEQGGWMAWYAYGKLAYSMVKKYERFLLPEPAVGDPVTKYEQLGPKAERWFEKGKGRTLTAHLVGKWPDFALAVQSYAGAEKLEKVALPLLGASRPYDFKEPLRTFVLKDVMSVLVANDRKTLEGMEGRWPEYPYALVRLAKQHDLSLPGMMLPGSPKRWDSMYGFSPRTRP